MDERSRSGEGAAGATRGRWLSIGEFGTLLGRLISTGAGRPLPDVAREALFGPLGIGTVEWMAGFDGVASAASGLRMAPRDLARRRRISTWSSR